ncbi:MAG: hypothetical protein LM572_05295, partial [Ignisphaera sp.]|nr:hypothetical protein [Ignisphaera sp.]
MLSDFSLVYAIATASLIPLALLIAMQLRHRRAELALLAGIGAFASLVAFTLIFTAPWICIEGESYTLWSSWKVLKVAGNVIARIVALASLFSVLGATLWLAEVDGGRGVLVTSSFIGLASVLIFIVLATCITMPSITTLKSVGIGVWASLALFAIIPTTTLARRRRKQGTVLSISEGSLLLKYIEKRVYNDFEEVLKILEEAK